MLTLFHYLPIASDFSQKSLRIVYRKMPDIYLSETFFQNLIIFITFRVRPSSNVANEMNHTVVLRIYLSLMVTNCSDERSFSKLEHVKNQERTSFGQDKLNYLTLLSIEHELLNEIEVKDIIKKFASQKARK